MVKSQGFTKLVVTADKVESVPVPIPDVSLFKLFESHPPLPDHST